MTNEKRKKILGLLLPICRVIEDESYAYELVQLIADIVEGE